MVGNLIEGIGSEYITGAAKIEKNECDEIENQT